MNCVAASEHGNRFALASLDTSCLNHRMDVYWCDAQDTVAAVAMLQHLSQLTSVSLGIHAHYGTDVELTSATELYPEWAPLPAMAAVTGLADLRLYRLAGLPPDWRQLSGLQTLKVCHSCVEQFQWGAGPLTSLTALTRLETFGMNEFGYNKWPGGWFPIAATYLGVNGCRTVVPTTPHRHRKRLQIQPCWPPLPAWPRCTPPSALLPGGRSWLLSVPTCASARSESARSSSSTHLDPPLLASRMHLFA